MVAADLALSSAFELLEGAKDRTLSSYPTVIFYWSEYRGILQERVRRLMIRAAMCGWLFEFALCGHRTALGPAVVRVRFDYWNSDCTPIRQGYVGVCV